MGVINDEDVKESLKPEGIKATFKNFFKIKKE